MQKLKILLWSPKGAGNHYYGPGKNALSLYGEIKRLVDINVVLVHAYPNHENLNAFDVMHEIGDYRKSNVLSFLKYLIIYPFTNCKILRVSCGIEDSGASFGFKCFKK